MVLSRGLQFAHRLARRSVCEKLPPFPACKISNMKKEKCCCTYSAVLNSSSQYEDRSARECYRILGLSRNAPRLQRKEPCHREQFCTSASNEDTEEELQEVQKISVSFVDKDGEEHQIKVPIGMSILEAAHENDIELEGACEGSLACSTCHVIVMDMEYYNILEDPADEENDMLDLAFGLTETSRLGCQIIAKPELDGIRLAIPAATRNFAVDGFKPKPH